MTSLIDPTQPPRGAPETLGCRSNFLAMKNEIEALQGATATGMIEMYAGSSAPTGWLMCRGQAVSRTTYAALYAVVGTTFGVGDGSTTFNLPDLEKRFPRGAGTAAVGDAGGAETVALDLASTPPHDHTGIIQSAGSHDHGGSIASSGGHTHSYTTSTDGGHTHTVSTSNTGDHTHTTTINSGGSHSHNIANASPASGNSHDHYEDGSPTTFTYTTGAAGSHSHTVTLASGGSHSHTVTPGTSGAHTHTVSSDTELDHTHTLTSDGDHTHTTAAVGSGTPHENMPAYLALNFIIKT